jgi:hypothetical protein
VKGYDSNTIIWITLLVGIILNSSVGIATGCFLVAINWFQLGWKKKALVYILTGMTISAILDATYFISDEFLSIPPRPQLLLLIAVRIIPTLIAVFILDQTLVVEHQSTTEKNIHMETFSLLPTVGTATLNILIALGIMVSIRFGIEWITKPDVLSTSNLISDGHQTVYGKLNPWSTQPITDRQIVLCKLSETHPLSPYHCHLTSFSATSDQAGKFSITNVDPGRYFVLYDTGMADFEEGLSFWEGKELEPGIKAWEKEHFDHLYQCGEDLIFILPNEVTDPRRSFYFHRTQYVFNRCGTYFLIAHDIETALSYEDHGQSRLPNDVFIPTVIEVVEDYDTYVEFDVLFSNQ